MELFKMEKPSNEWNFSKWKNLETIQNKKTKYYN